MALDMSDAYLWSTILNVGAGLLDDDDQALFNPASGSFAYPGQQDLASTLAPFLKEKIGKGLTDAERDLYLGKGKTSILQQAKAQKDKVSSYYSSQGLKGGAIAEAMKGIGESTFPAIAGLETAIAEKDIAAKQSNIANALNFLNVKSGYAGQELPDTSGDDDTDWLDLIAAGMGGASIWELLTNGGDNGSIGSLISNLFSGDEGGSSAATNAISGAATGVGSTISDVVAGAGAGIGAGASAVTGAGAGIGAGASAGVGAATGAAAGAGTTGASSTAAPMLGSMASALAPWGPFIGTAAAHFIYNAQREYPVGTYHTGNFNEGGIRKAFNQAGSKWTPEEGIAMADPNQLIDPVDYYYAGIEGGDKLLEAYIETRNNVIKEFNSQVSNYLDSLPEEERKIEEKRISQINFAYTFPNYEQNFNNAEQNLTNFIEEYKLHLNDQLFPFTKYQRGVGEAQSIQNILTYYGSMGMSEDLIKDMQTGGMLPMYTGSYRLPEDKKDIDIWTYGKETNNQQNTKGERSKEETIGWILSHS